MDAEWGIFWMELGARSGLRSDVGAQGHRHFFVIDKEACGSSTRASTEYGGLVQPIFSSLRVGLPSSTRQLVLMTTNNMNFRRRWSRELGWAVWLRPSVLMLLASLYIGSTKYMGYPLKRHIQVTCPSTDACENFKTVLGSQHRH